MLSGALGVVAVVLALAGIGGGGASATPAVRVVLARRALAAGQPVRADDLSMVAVPESAAVRDALGDTGSAVGQRPAVPVPAGTVLMAAELAVPSAGAEQRDVAVRLDDAAGVPSGDLDETRADLYLTTPGRRGTTAPLARDVLVVSAEARDDATVATLRVPGRLVRALIAAEGRGSLRLVVRS